MSDSEGVLARWSRRKLAAKQGDAATETIDETATEGVAEQTPPTSGPREVVTEARGTPGNEAQTTDEGSPALPPIEQLNAESDFTVFLGKGVPEALTRAALRKLWLSDPVLANVDGLNNYDEDYNVVDQAITAAQTSYRPGLGYFDELEDKVAKLDDILAEKISAESNESPSEEGLGPVDAPGEDDAPKDETAVASQQDGPSDQAEGQKDSPENTGV